MAIGVSINIREFSSGKILQDINIYSEDVQSRLKLCRNAIAYIIDNEKEYINNCVITFGDSLELIDICIEKMNSSKERNFEDLSSRLIVSVFHMIYEKAIVTGEWEISSEFPVIEFMLDKEVQHTRHEEIQIPIWTFGLQKKLSSLAINNRMLELNAVSGKIESLNNDYKEKVNQWISVIDEWNEKLKGYKDSVEKMTSQYNFFGLARAFKNLIDGKKRDLWWMNWYLRGMAIVVILPLVASIYLSYLIWGDINLGIDPMKSKILLGLPVLIPLEVILIYFFRIILKEQLSLKAQILQLELRYSVCAFIEEYAKFSKSVEKDKLDKFEALIFSGITPDPATVPSTFDGIEQLAGFLQKFQK